MTDEENPLTEAESLFADFARKRESVEIAPGRFVECRAVSLSARVGLGQVGGSIDTKFAALVMYGCPVFSGCSAAEIEDQLDPEVLQALAAKVMELSGLGRDQEAKAEKNSESGPKSK